MMISILLAAVLAAASPAERQSAAVTLDDFGGRLRSVRLTVNGQEGVFTVDTGGGVSLITPKFAQRIGCQSWAAHTGFRLTGERLDMPRCEGVQFVLPGGSKLQPVAAGVLDLQPLLWPGAPEVDGSIALDAFEGRIVELDLGAGSLELHEANQPKVPDDRAVNVPIRQTRQAGGAALVAAVPVATPKGRLWMALDSGSGAPLLVRDRVAADLGLDAAAKTPQPIKLQLAGAEPVVMESRAIVRDMILDGVIGLPTLVRWALIIDLVNDTVWLRQTR